MTTFFISDCHLSADSDLINEKFFTFLKNLDRNDTLYILGDFFDRWIGDDDASDFPNFIQHVLKGHTQSGLTIFIMHGNRDFLLGDRFCQQTGCHLLADPTCIELAGQTTILSHGDAFCIDDTNYLRFRRVMRSSAFQAIILTLPVTIRQKLGHVLYSTTRHTRVNADTNEQAILQCLNAHQATQLIHGHTHKPAIEHRQRTGTTFKKFVLSDWHHQGHFLAVDESGHFSSQFF